MGNNIQKINSLLKKILLGISYLNIFKTKQYNIKMNFSNKENLVEN